VPPLKTSVKHAGISLLTLIFIWLWTVS